MFDRFLHRDLPRMKRPKRPKRSMKSRLISAAINLVIVGVGIGIWQLVVSAYHVSSLIFPTPGETWHALYSGLSNLGPSSYWSNGRTTLIEMVLGFVAGLSAGVVIGIATGKSRILDRIAYPYVVAFNALPKIALAPLLVLWLGFGIASKVVLVMAITFFPIMVNLTEGLKSVDSEMVDLYRVLGASTWRQFVSLEWPSALPSLFSGIQIAAIFSILAAVVGEFVGAQHGLGLQLVNADDNIQTAAVFALLVIFAIMGLIAIQLVRAAQRYFVFWINTDSTRESSRGRSDRRRRGTPAVLETASLGTTAEATDTSDTPLEFSLGTGDHPW